MWDVGKPQQVLVNYNRMNCVNPDQTHREYREHQWLVLFQNIPTLVPSRIMFSGHFKQKSRSDTTITHWQAHQDKCPADGTPTWMLALSPVPVLPEGQVFKVTSQRNFTWWIAGGFWRRADLCGSVSQHAFFTPQVAPCLLRVKYFMPQLYILFSAICMKLLSCNFRCIVIEKEMSGDVVWRAGHRTFTQRRGVCVPRGTGIKC